MHKYPESKDTQQSVREYHKLDERLAIPKQQQQVDKNGICERALGTRVRLA